MQPLQKPPSFLPPNSSSSLPPSTPTPAPAAAAVAQAILGATPAAAHSFAANPLLAKPLAPRAASASDAPGASDGQRRGTVEADRHGIVENEGSQRIFQLDAINIQPDHVVVVALCRNSQDNLLKIGMAVCDKLKDHSNAEDMLQAFIDPNTLYRLNTVIFVTDERSDICKNYKETVQDIGNGVISNGGAKDGCRFFTNFNVQVGKVAAGATVSIDLKGNILVKNNNPN